MIKKFDSYINESIADIFNVKYTYADKVRRELTEIIMEVNGISEKSFSRVDEVIKNTKELFANNDKVKEIVAAHETGDKRPQLCAEIIYDEIIKNK